VDIALIAKAYGSKAEDARYRPSCDLNTDGVIDIVDLAVAATNFGKTETPNPYEGKVFACQFQERALNINALQYALPLNLTEVSGYAALKDLLGIAPEQESYLSGNGFVVLRKNPYETVADFYDHFFDVSEWAGGSELPTLVTTDSVLYAYHIVFDDTLKRIEMNEFIKEINATLSILLTEAQKEAQDLSQTPLKDASLLVVKYLEVAHALMQPSFRPSTTEANEELRLISAHDEIAVSPIFGYKEDYSQYVPRGHYTQNEQLQAYFRTMMWLGRMRFTLLTDGHIDVEQTRAAALLTLTVARNAGVYYNWIRMYQVTAFFVGTSDDLTFDDYLAVLEENGITSPEQTFDKNAVANLGQELLSLNEAKIIGTPFSKTPFSKEDLQKAFNDTAGLRFMGQRFIPDSYMFQQLVFPQVGNHTLPRLFPKGLDVPAVLGSDVSRSILNRTETMYENYTSQLESLREQFQALNIENWTKNLYWSWLFTANSTLQVIPSDAAYPTFMTRPAWGYEKLQTFMGTWTELRHDTILYAKPSGSMGWGGPPGGYAAYVEPYPETYRRLIGLVNMTVNGLESFGLIPQDTNQYLNWSLTSFMNACELFLNASILELQGESLSESMQFSIGYSARRLWDSLSAAEKTAGVASVADVHTEYYSGTVLEEGVGKFNVLVVVYSDPDGTLHAAAGPVYSYFEFTQPINNRLTDESWRNMLATNPPKPPEWTNLFSR